MRDQNPGGTIGFGCCWPGGYIEGGASIYEKRGRVSMRARMPSNGARREGAGLT